MRPDEFTNFSNHIHLHHISLISGPIQAKEPSKVTLEISASCPEIITKHGPLFRGRHIQTTFTAHRVDDNFYKTRDDINWIIHEAEQHLLSHPMVRLLDARDRRIRSEKVTFIYVPEGSHSGIHIDPLSRIYDNPPPTQRRESRDWDKDPEGRQSPKIVHLKVKICLRWDRPYSSRASKQDNHICTAPPHTTKRDLFKYLDRTKGLNVLIIPPSYPAECQNCYRRANNMVRQTLETVKGGKGTETEYGIYKARRGGGITVNLPYAINRLWDEAEEEGWALEGIPHNHRDEATPLLQQSVFKLVSPSDQTVYIYRVDTTNSPVETDWEEEQSPMVIRLSAETIQIEHGRERFSQNMTYPPWQTTAQKDSKQNKKSKVHRPKPSPPQKGEHNTKQKNPKPSGTETTEPPTVGESTAATQRTLDTHEQQDDAAPKVPEDHDPHPEDHTNGVMESQPTQAEPPAKETPPIQKRPDVLKELGELRAQVENQTTPGQKRNSHRRPSWRSGAYRPPIKEGQSNIKPATREPRTPNEA